MNRKALIDQLSGDDAGLPDELRPVAAPRPATVDLSGYAQRGPVGGGNLFAEAAKGAAMGSVVPGMGTAVGAGYGALKSIIGKKAKTASSDYAVADARDAINRQYQQSWGKDATAQEIDGILRGQGWQTGDRFVGQGGLQSVLSATANNAARQLAAQGGSPQSAAATTLPEAAPMAAPPAVGQNYDFLGGGYNRDKLNDQNKQNAKYSMGRTLAGFDSRQGITPDVLAALNALGYGTFSGQGDKLSLAGLTDKGRQAELVGDYQGADFIEGFKGGNGKWSYQDPAEEARLAREAPPGLGGGLPNMGGMHPLLGGDALANIQAALGQFSGPSSNIQALLAQLQGGR